MTTTTITIEDLRRQVARRISDYRIKEESSTAGTLWITVRNGLTRTFRAHWTGYKLFFRGKTIVLKADLGGGSFYSEGYISLTQASYVLAFRKKPPAVRGTGAERPDDKFAAPQAIEVAHQHRQRLIEAGEVADEEIIRYEDLDDPIEAIDAFFNYTSFYCLKALGTTWSDIGFTVDPTLGWGSEERAIASLPIDEAIEEGLKRSDIIWVTPDPEEGGRPLPCWFVYTKDKRIFLLSGEPEQIIPNAMRVRDAHVVTRWKGRDARLAEFDASVRTITAADGHEFREIGDLLVAKRQSATGSTEENVERWMREGAVILELIPRT